MHYIPIIDAGIAIRANKTKRMSALDSEKENKSNPMGPEKRPK